MIPIERVYFAMPTTSARRRWVSVSEAAEHLGVTPKTVREMVADGRLTAYRNGPRIVRLDLNEVDAAMQPFGGGGES